MRKLTNILPCIPRTPMQPTNVYAPALLELATLHWANKDSFEKEEQLTDDLEGKLPKGEYLVGEYMIVVSSKPGENTSISTIRRLKRLG